MHKTVVIDAVGLTPALAARVPSLKRLEARSPVSIGHVLPAVTCSVQATYLTGTMPREHGIVGNGWYFRDECEVRFWHQSDRLIERPRIWTTAKQRDPSFTCANIGWWNAMYSGADFTVTPRPMYLADGRKLPDIWTHPAHLRDSLQRKLGQFPLFKFWGPGASIESSQWLANAAIEVDREFHPTLTLIYLPHLDYALQKFGPDDPRIDIALAELDRTIAVLLDHFLDRVDARVMILSEYGIEPVNRPIHLNRVLREHRLIETRDELGHELLDAGASAAFAVADHQVAHVYVNDLQKLAMVERLLRSTPGVAEVLDRAAQKSAGIDHPRSGDLVVVAEPGAWFTYYYWLDDSHAPDFARLVEIHRKPGYDPAELFLDPQLAMPKLQIAWRLLKRRLGFRMLMDLIPLDASLVKGSHGRAASRPEHGAMLISSIQELVPTDSVKPTDVCDLILRHLGV